MNSAPGHFQLPRPGELFDFDSLGASCSSQQLLPPLLPSARTFDFAWVSDSQFADRSPPAVVPAPRSFSSYTSFSPSGSCSSQGTRLQHQRQRLTGLAAVSSTPRTTTTVSPTGSTASNTSQDTYTLPALASASSSSSASAVAATPTARGCSAPETTDKPSPPSSVKTTSSRAISPRSTKFKMPGRPAKRSADGGGGDDDDSSTNATKMKLARSDRGPEDFSSVVKNRLSSYTRTGQACDRCKVRKIRCDALPEGCSHCINLSLECYVTDRVTGRTERRGYIQELEREKNSMMSHIRDLERLAAEKGVDVKPWNGVAAALYPPGASMDEAGNIIRESSSGEEWSSYGSLWIKGGSPAPSGAKFLPNLPRSQWESRPDQSHLGVGPDDAPLSSMKGTKLTILGTTIETTGFNAPDVDEPPSDVSESTPIYNKSIQAFLRSTMGINPPLSVEMPSRENAFMYAEWYFLSVAAFLPVLHKPSFLRLLTNVYDDPTFKPSIPEQVHMHMVFAIIYFQFGVRNCQQIEQRNNFNDLSNKHYHFALSKMYDIFSSSELVAVQALALISSHTRSFPKPGCGSIVANMALHRALELNFHRATRKTGNNTDLQTELKKRAWWVIMATIVAINGKRGYPVPLAVQDFDIEFPEPLADELLSDRGVDTSRAVPCPFEVGLASFRAIPMFMEMYANLYSVRRDPGGYKTVIDAGEAELEKWEAELPQVLRLLPNQKLDQEVIGPIFARTFALEYRLCLRHPSIAQTSDPKLIAENTRICEETAREYLSCCEQLTRMKSLDTTWYQISVYCVAILSILVPQWERRFEITADEVSKLRDEMQRWMAIVKEISRLLGCGDVVASQIGILINRTMSWIEHDMGSNDSKKPAVASVKQEHLAPSQQPQHTQGGQVQQQPAGQAQGYSTAQHVPPAVASQEQEPTKSYYQQDNNNNNNNNTASSAHASYPSLAYIDHARHSNAAPPQPTAYHQEQSAMFYPASSAAAGVQHHAPASAEAMAVFASQAGQHLATQAPADMMWARNPWHSWTAAIADTQDRYSANALLTLGAGGGGGAGAGRGQVITPIMTDEGIPLQPGPDMTMVTHASQWPLTMFDHNHHG